MTDTGSGNSRPTYRSDQDSIWREIRNLWMKVNGTNVDTKPTHEIIWSIGGALNSTDDPSQRWIAPYSLVVSSVVITLGIVGTGDTVILMYLDDVVRGTYTIHSGAKTEFVSENFKVKANQMIHLKPTGTFGVGATNLAFIMRYSQQ